MLFYQNTINNSDAIENKVTNIDKIVYLNSTGNKDIKKICSQSKFTVCKIHFLKHQLFVQIF